VLAPSLSTSKITSMFALNLPSSSLRKSPTVLVQDRFPCSWLEWKELEVSLNLGLVPRDESVLVVVVPMPAGVFIMNPSTDGNADFLGEIVAIPWQRVKSHGAHPRTNSVSFRVVLNEKESIFTFRTPKAETIDALFTKFIYLRADELFPTRWPPLRYTSANNPDLNRPGVYTSSDIPK
jgi:hypothetical protein